MRTPEGRRTASRKWRISTTRARAKSHTPHIRHAGSMMLWMVNIDQNELDTGFVLGFKLVRARRQSLARNGCKPSASMLEVLGQPWKVSVPTC